MTTANTSLTGKVPHTSNSSPSFWNLKDWSVASSNTVLCCIASARKQLSYRPVLVDCSQKLISVYDAALYIKR